MVFGIFLVCGGIEQTAMKLLFFSVAPIDSCLQTFDFYFYLVLVEIGMNHWKSYFFHFSRHDWYQTESHIVVTVMAKNVSKDGVCVSFTEKEV